MNSISDKLHQKGYRLTKQREKILGVLNTKPQSVEDVLLALKSQRIAVDKVTVYRTLNCFVDLGIAGKTQFRESVAKYELLEKSDHHHHLVCDNCGSVEDIPLNEDNLIQKVNDKTDFQIKSHTLEFFGLCGQCRSL